MLDIFGEIEIQFIKGM